MQYTRWDPKPKVAVIGAGVSGLICARNLADHGCDVRVYEKSRGVGGRMSTRRVDDDLAFDHGAQYFTARDARFRQHVKSWIRDGLVQPWKGRIVSVEQAVVQSQQSADDRYVAVPGMNAIGKHIASDLDVQLNTRVTAPTQVRDKWLLTDDGGVELGQFDVVVVAVPSHQAATLLAGVPQLADQAASVTMSSCWALMLAFDESLELGFDGAFVNDSPLSWIACDSSKPGRNRNAETWVVHASPEWTEAHLDDSTEQISQALLSEFRTVTGTTTAQPTHLDTQRWRFAIPTTTLPGSCLFDDHQKIGACGDWCGGPRVEGAFLSGMAIVGRILARFNDSCPEIEPESKD